MSEKRRYCGAAHGLLSAVWLILRFCTSLMAQQDVPQKESDRRHSETLRTVLRGSYKKIAPYHSKNEKRYCGTTHSLQNRFTTIVWQDIVKYGTSTTSRRIGHPNIVCYYILLTF